MPRHSPHVQVRGLLEADGKAYRFSLTAQTTREESGTLRRLVRSYRLTA
jgi:hypothetical protein